MQNAEARATLFKLLGLAETSEEPNVAVLMQLMNDAIGPVDAPPPPAPPT